MDFRVLAVVHIHRHLLPDHTRVRYGHKTDWTYPALELLLREDYRLHGLLR